MYFSLLAKIFLLTFTGRWLFQSIQQYQELLRHILEKGTKIIEI